MSETPSEERSHGMVQQLLRDMPPVAKTVLMWFLLFPVALAISGMLLQVNVGAIIQASLMQSRDQTVDVVGTMLTEKMADMERRLAAVENASTSSIKYGGQIDTLDKRVTTVEQQVRQLRDWACDNDKAKGLGSCGVGN